VVVVILLLVVVIVAVVITSVVCGMRRKRKYTFHHHDQGADSVEMQIPRVNTYLDGVLDGVTVPGSEQTIRVTNVSNYEVVTGHELVHATVDNMESKGNPIYMEPTLCALTKEGKGVYFDMKENLGVEVETKYYSVDGPYADESSMQPDPAPYEVPLTLTRGSETSAGQEATYDIIPTKEEREKGRSSLKKVQLHSEIVYEAMDSWQDSLYDTPASDTDHLYDQLAGRGCIEIPQKSLKLKHLLGKGEFGDVYRGDWETPYGFKDVAVKLLRENAQEEDIVKFLQEATIMAQFRHPNIVGFLGAVTLKQPNMIVLELLVNGDLSAWLNKERTNITAEKNKNYPSKLLKFCRDVADGALYLSSKQFVHRDLAARNILLDKNMKCKIADFGLARDLSDESYYKSHGKKIPIRWTAPEAILYKTYSTMSDVWSYGCVLFEIWSLGLKPYPDLSPNEIIEHLVRKQTYTQYPPTGCPRMIYELMRKCWQYNPSSRPTFKDILKTLKEPTDQLLSVPWEDLWSTTDPRRASMLGKDLRLMKDVYKDLQTMK
jgi:ephrin-B